MNSIFNEPNNLFTRAPAAAATAMAAWRGDWVLYLLAAFIIAVVIMMLMNVKIDVSKLDPRPRSWIVSDTAQKFWKPSQQFTNMTITDTEAPANFSDTLYSIAFDCKILNSRNYGTTEGPYRHILHRGSDELKQATLLGAICNGAQLQTGSNFPPFGLPKRMNPGIFLDPNTNDILLFIDTTNGGESYRESVRIADLPLDTPFRLALVVSANVLEVYLNCRLEVTKLLNGVPKNVENMWYGLTGPANAMAQIQNLYIWKQALGADDVGTLCPRPAEFTMKRPDCTGESEPTAVTSVAKVTDLGFGAKLSTCST